MLGGEIRRWIEDHGIRFSYVARKAGISQQAFVARLNGQSKITAEEYFRICQVLGVELDTFAQDTRPASSGD